jgi:PAS domain S-box-containing protein
MAEADLQSLNDRVPVESGERRHTGITAIGDVPWGAHFCQFYQDKQDLIDILVPYFKAGLENNEFCMWITSEPLGSAEAKAALAANLENLETYFANGQLEILDSDWYTSGRAFESDRVLQSWVDRLEAARRRGFAGLRLTGNPSWLEKPEWHGFMEYEATVDAIFGQRRMLAICTYSLPKCDALQIMDVISNHAFALVKRAGKWEVIAHEDTVVQKNRLKAVLEALPAGVALIDAQGGKVESNAAFEQAWAGPLPATRFEDYAARKAWWVDTGKPVQPDEWASARAVQKGETVVNQEMQIERFDGSRAFVLNSAAPIRDAQGRISGSAVAISDITQLKHAEEALRESESRFRALVTATSDVVYRMSPDWKMMLYLRGRDFIPDTEEPSGTWLQKYIHSDDQAYVMAAIGEAIRTKSTFELEHRVRRVDGCLGWTFSRAIPIQNGDGEIVEWFGAATDITERKRAEEALRRSEARWNATIENLETGVVIATDTEQVIYRNPAALTMHGFTRDQGGLGPLQEMSRIFQLWTPDGRLLTLDEWPMRRIKCGETVNRLELRLRRPDQGWEKIISYSGGMVESAIGERLMFVSAQDLTDQRKAEQALRESEKLESLGTLASGIAHDFNNLLGAVLAQAELAAAGLAAGSHPDEELETIREVAIRGSDIVRQLMIYAGKEDDVFEFIDISNTVREIYGLLKSAISKRATLVTDLSEHLPPIKARPAQLRQVVMNLVVNASDALKDTNGVIRVTTQRVTLGPNNSGATKEGLAEGDYVQLEVSDTGSGMSHATQARIFDPFFSTKSTGRGLGLPVIHGIVRSLHGAIRVESEVGKGTTFQILLPSEGNAALLTFDTVAGNERALYRSLEATVIVVEDEAPLRLAVKKMLGMAGLTVLEAADGTEAVELLHSKALRIDLLILDITLPGCSSHEVLREAVESWPQIKVILTSAYSEEMARASLTASQVCGFVRKPFQLSKLLSTLRNALSS